MKLQLLQLVGLVWFSTSAVADTGGINVVFAPETAMPGDLVTLTVTMDRDDYGEFNLEVPSHPQLHLVAREQVPPQLIDGTYRQSERLMLQALSSGEITLTGMTAQLTEAAGVRTVELPETRLTVQPFATTDEAAAPEALPDPKSDRGSALSIAIPLFIMITGGLILILLIRLKLSLPVESAKATSEETLNFDAVLRAASISNEDLEAILNAKGDHLSEALRNQLERFLYTSESGDDQRSELHSQLRKELDT